MPSADEPEPRDESDAPGVFETNLHSLPLIARGKVRDNYAVGEDRILMVASDRISAFDVVMNEPIAGKGRLLTEMALFWFERLQHIVPNHLTGDDPESVVAADEREQVRGRSMLVKRLQPLPIEAVVRGYLAGSGWKEYQASGSVSGVALPPGLQLASKLPAPIFTPATKAEAGHHDENIDFERMSELVGEQRAREVRDISFRLYAEAAEHALSRGIIIADTKFEFGTDASGMLVLMDEVLTPDSSRYWPVEEWEPGKAPPSYDKQVLRDWLEAVWVDGVSWSKAPPPPKLDPEIVQRTRRIYEQARDAMLAAEAVPRSAQVDALEQALLAEQDPLAADDLRVDLTVALARTGRLIEADRVVAELRKRRARNPHSVLTIRMNFAEGVADYFSGRTRSAFDKMQRANLLARAVANDELQAICAAWLAHFAWNEADVYAAAAFSRESLSKARPTDHQARVRVSLVLAEVLAISRRDDLAEPWIKRVQLHAAALSDRGVKSTMAFNLASTAVMLFRQDVLDGIASDDRADMAEQARRTSHNIDAAFGVFDEMGQLQDAQFFSLRGRVNDALKIYLHIAKRAVAPGATEQRSVWLADQAWCFSRLGRHSEALRTAAQATAAIHATTQIDDLASIHSMLSAVYRAAGNSEQADHYLHLAQTQWAEYRRFQQTCISLCEGITETG